MDTLAKKCDEERKKRGVLTRKRMETSTMKTNYALFLATVLVAAGCATAPKAPPAKYVYFPSSPNPPRVQYLTAYSSERDLRGPDSAFAFYITGQAPKENPFGKPYGVAAHDHKIFVCDSAMQAVLILDLDKKKMSALPAEGDAALPAPINIAVDGDNHYIVDIQRSQVLCLNAAGQAKWILGQKDEMRPSDVAFDADRIYIADLKGHAVRVYNKADQKLLFMFPQGEDATNKNSLLAAPSNLAIGPKGQIYVSDSVAGRVSIFDRDGKFLRNVGEIGDDPNSGFLKRPKGIAVDRDGILYVVDASYELVQMFDAEGHYLMCFGYPRSSAAAGMTLPAKVIIDYDDAQLFEKETAPDFKVDYLLIVTNQFGGRKVAIYAFGHKK
jgi:DNA-binding beta-propeller fold protein YncE